jgi:hypothetical protein
VDGDGSDEILFASPADSTVHRIKAPAPNDAAAPVAEEVWRSEPGGRARLVVAADMDQDGDLDLLVPDDTEPPGGRTSVNVLVNDGSGSFSHHALPFPGATKSEGGMTGIRGLDAAQGRDGRVLVLAAGYEGLALYRFSDAWPTKAAEVLALDYPVRSVVAEIQLHDIDADGWLDAVIGRANRRSGLMIIYGPLWKHMSELEPAHLVPPPVAGAGAS